MQSSDARRAKTSEDGSRQAADLNWLAFLITGQRDVSIDIAADTVTAQYGGGSLFNDWMRAWSRRTRSGHCRSRWILPPHPHPNGRSG